MGIIGDIKTLVLLIIPSDYIVIHRHNSTEDTGNKSTVEIEENRNEN